MYRPPVLILAAGYGRRMGPFSRMVNKCLVPYDNKPLLSHIFDAFGIDSKFYIACGNMGQQVKDYVKLVHQEKDITFIDIPEFDETTTGPATTLAYCADFLGDRYYWISCDTLFKFNRDDKLDHNWIGVYPVDSTVSQDYCWVERDGNDIISVKNKIPSSHAVDAFIGLMYVHTNEFTKNLHKVTSKDVWEAFPVDLKAHTVSQWYDFGTYEKWKSITEGLPEMSFPKPEEIFYRDNGKIVKFNTDATLPETKNFRARLNKSCMPSNIRYAGNFLSYDEVPGDTLYNSLSPDLFCEFLDWCEKSVWIGETKDDAWWCATQFYKTKTFERLEKFRIKYNDWVEFPLVNGQSVKTIEEYINEIDFDWLASDTKFCFIHGDMQFDNVIYDPANKFKLIDWRPDFAGSSQGDLYYDLAKMLGGIYLSYKYVKEDKISYLEDGDCVHLGVPSVDDAEVYVSILKNWVKDKGYDWYKVCTLVPVIYLNMAPLHEPPFDKFLIALAQLHFSQL